MPDKDEVPGSSPGRPTTVLPAQSAVAPRPVAPTALPGPRRGRTPSAQSRPRPSRSRPPSAQIMVGLMPAIMSLTTCAQLCRRWANLAAYPVPYRRAVPANRLLLVGQAVEPGRWPRTSRRPRPSRRLRWPSTACASFERQAPTRADDQPVVDTVRGDHADSGRLRRVAARRIGALDELTRFGHSSRGTPG
jgi:hypothetical protein